MNSITVQPPIPTSLPPPAPVVDTLTSPQEQQDPPVMDRTRRQVPRAQGPGQPAFTAGMSDEEVLMIYQAKMSQGKLGVKSQDYRNGYETPSSVNLPGYVKSMNDVQLMRLALDQHFSPEQLGALQRIVEQRIISSVQNNVRVFSKIVSGEGVKLTPLPQSYFLSMVNQLSGGECAGFSHLLSLAVAEGKHHTFMSNAYQAIAHPDTPESQAFFNEIAKVQSRVKERGIAHDPATVKLEAYATIASRLQDAPATQTLLISSKGHRLSAGVIVDPQGKRTYYYSDPNIGLVEFSSLKAFEQGLKKIFTSPELSHLTSPVQSGPGGPKYLISVFNSNHVPEVNGASNSIKFMYDAPLAGLDTVKVIDASRLPTLDEFRAQSPAPEPAQKADYDRVTQGLKKLHDAKGMPQFHQALEVLDSVKTFIASYPNSPLVSVTKNLQQRLVNVINESAAPAQYPFVFERMERERTNLARDSIHEPKRFHVEDIAGVKVQISSHHDGDPNRPEKVTDAIRAALLKLQHSDPDAAKSVGKEIKVIIANPGDQPQSQLRLDNPPTLIVGDDFFAPASARGDTVADRAGSEALAKGADGTAQKQAAMIAGKLGMVGYYKATPKEFLSAMNNTEPFRDGGHQLSARASRSQFDFLEESFVAGLYDGKLDSSAEESRKKLLSPRAEKDPKPVPVKPTTPGVVPIDEAQVKHLQKLDASHGPLRIGELDVSRVELYKMGGSINGRPVEAALAGDTDGSKLISQLQIDYPRFAAHLRAEPGEAADRVANVLAEIAAHRSPVSEPLIQRGDGSTIAEALQKQVHELREHHASIKALKHSKQPMPEHFFSSGNPGPQAGSRAGGLAFQAFSSFQGLRTSIEALQRGDTTAGALGLGAVASDFVGAGIEVGANKLAQKVVNASASTVLDFKSSSFGKMIGKIAGVAGAAISIPFDAYNAIDSFNKAGRSTGKEAQDHYVHGASAVANAVTSIALGAAFLAGAGAAGPAGLIVAGTLMAAQAIYSAVRTVEDIDEHTPLTDEQKFSIGMKSFLGFEPGFDIIKPYLEAKYSKEHESRNWIRHKTFLKGPAGQHFERVVFGSTDVEAKLVPGKVPLTPFLWYSPITWVLNLGEIDGEVPSVGITGGNDHISSPFKSWNGKPVNAVEGEPGENKATLWDLGDGDDWVTGMQKKPNYFLLGAGKKGINGGDADDTVVLNADARQVLEQAQQVSETEKAGFSPRQTSLNGGGGRNTLSFSGALSVDYEENGEKKAARYQGHVIDMNNNTVSVKTERSNTQGVKKIAHFQSFSNVATVEKGESYIQGNHENNWFVLNGTKDEVFTGQGNNLVTINGGAHVTGQGGTNTYIVNKHHEAVTIDDPGSSTVKLDYSAEQVTGWSVSPSGDLTVKLTVDSDLDTGPQERALTFKNAFSTSLEGGNMARPTFITNDGVMMSVTAQRKTGSWVSIPGVSRMKIDLGKPAT